jgi:diguanylate cyclase (GGDEF)-like protein
VTGVLLVLVGLLGGFLAGFQVARRRAVPRASRSVHALADEFLASDTATHIAAGSSMEESFGSLALALVERCANRVELPCALVIRERTGAPAFIVEVSTGFDPRLVGVEVPLDSTGGRAIADGIPVVSEGDEKVISFSRDRRRAISGGIAVPVAQGPDIVGAVIAFGVPAAGNEDAIAGLSELVRKFAPVLVPAHTAAVAVRRSETDELTGLPNRRALNRVTARRGVDLAGLVMLDVDHFKEINDTFGHPAGDAALRHVARILRETLRDRDLAARIGGEEFAIWLPGADQRTAVEVAERLRERVATSPFRAEGQERILTVSCGVASYPTPIGAIENLMGAADIALYRAKRAGRNKVVLSMDPAQDQAEPIQERRQGLG